MKIFLFNLTRFVIISFFLAVSVFIFLDYINNDALQSYRVKSNVRTLFVGDSHISMTIDDKLLSHSINISQNSEFCIDSYYKIQTILQNNPSIQKLYLGLGFHNISDYVDDFIYGEHSKDVSARYFFILPFEKKIYFLKQNLRYMPSYLLNIFSNGFNTLVKKPEYYSFMGYFENKYTNSSPSKKLIDEKILLHFYHNGKLRAYSAMNIYYLYKIKDLCHKKKVELIILNAPIDSYYRSKIPLNFVNKYNDIIKLNNLELIDFRDLVLQDSCFFTDGHHVSAKGAVLTTKYLNE
jgi:hypothetical protein